MVAKCAGMFPLELCLLFGLFFFLFACSGRNDVAPPVAKVIPKAGTVHGEVRVDDYYWLRERDNPEVIQYLEAENAYTEAVMKPTAALQEKLYQEMLGRIKETDLSVPERIEDYYYYSRTEEGKQYRIHCRKRGSLEADEQVLLDENRLAEGKVYFRLGVFEVSPNHQLLAYSVDSTGAETYRIYVKNLDTGELLSDEIPNTYYSVEWGNDNRTLFYTTLDEAKRPYKLFRHTLGSDPAADELVHLEEDDAYFLSISKTRSQKYMILRLASNTTTENWFLDADRPEGDFRLIHPRQHKMEYEVEHHGNRFFILTNENAINFKLMEAPVSNPAKKNWREVIAHRDSVLLDDVDAFRNHLVISERAKGLRQLRVIDMTTGEHHHIDFPEPVYTVWLSRNPDFNTELVRFNYTSLVTPRSVYDYNMRSRQRELKKQYEVLGDYDPSLYASERIFAEAPDGTEVPISLVYKRALFNKDGGNPLWLYGYGSYGATIDPRFNSNRLSLLDRGFVFAIAHVRGGGALGRPWYEDGKLLNKRNTFTDFIACAEHLIAENYTSKDRLVISGGSAGGLLMGAVTNMRPDLFEAVVAKVPFVDVVNTMLDASIPLTVIEYEEWGNPHEKAYYDYIKSYSPYDNVTTQDYPDMLITAGLNDPRVQYWEPAKWTAKLRAMKTDDNLLLLKTNMGAGHSGASGRYEYLREIAFEYAFVLHVLGMEELKG